METNKELIDQLREYAGNAGYSHQDYADTMRLAAAALSQRSEAVPVDDYEAFATWKGYPLPALNSDGQFPDEWMHREYRAYQAGRRNSIAPSAAAGEQPFPFAWPHAQRIVEAEQFLKTYSDPETRKLLDYEVQPIIRVLASMIGQWQQAAAYAMSADNCAAQPTPAQGDAVPVAAQQNGGLVRAALAAKAVPDGWQIVPIKLTRRMKVASKEFAGLYRSEAARWSAILAAAPSPAEQGDAVPVATKCAACNGEGWVRDIHDMEQGRIRCTKCATRHSSADAVDAARAVVDAWDKCNGYPDTNMEISAIGNAVDALRASIAAQGGKGGAG